jgi:hypothetical protein
MTIQELQYQSKQVRRDASREYVRAKSTGRAAEVKRETDEEIRAALRGEK